MIKGFYIDNFKSLADFRLPPRSNQLGSFTCLVRLNGVGKSTMLQAFDFVGHLAIRQVVTWLRQRERKASDLTNRFFKKKLIQFELEVMRIDTPSFNAFKQSLHTAAQNAALPLLP